MLTILPSTPAETGGCILIRYREILLPLGTVTRNGCDAGALVRIEATGMYLQVNAGVVRSLDTRKVVAALGAAGRSSKMLTQ